MRNASGNPFTIIYIENYNNFSWPRRCEMFRFTQKMIFIIIRHEIDEPFTRVLKVIDIGVTNVSMGSKTWIYSANLNDFAFVMKNILFELFFNNTQVSKHGCYFLFSSSYPNPNPNSTIKIQCSTMRYQSIKMRYFWRIFTKKQRKAHACIVL